MEGPPEVRRGLLKIEIKEDEFKSKEKTENAGRGVEGLRGEEW